MASMASGSGAWRRLGTRGRGWATTVWVNMSSGKTSTTGPGRPCMAVAKARATYSGMRLASSMRSTRLAMPWVLGPKKVAKSISWKASRSRASLATSPTNKTMGVLS